VWERFTKACNYFFEERKRQNSAIRQEENANLAAKRAIIEALRAINVDELEREDALKQVKELQAQWQTIGHVPFRQKDIIFAEYREVADELYGKLDVRNNRRRMNNFQEQISDISGDDNKLSRERDRLYRQYEAKKTELKTAENNLGFFNVKSSEGNFMVKEMERRIKKIGEEMQMLEEKIALINEKMQ
jgi:chromosome segregation ATPase